MIVIVIFAFIAGVAAGMAFQTMIFSKEVKKHIGAYNPPPKGIKRPTNISPAPPPKTNSTNTGYKAEVGGYQPDDPGYPVTAPKGGTGEVARRNDTD